MPKFHTENTQAKLDALMFRRPALTIEQHASELLDLLADEDPDCDPPGRRLIAR